MTQADDASDSAASPREEKAFDQSFWIFAVLAFGTGAAVAYWHGVPAFLAALRDDGSLVLMLLPKLLVAMIIAVFLQTVLPQRAFGRIMGEQSGIAGIAVATTAGALTPGGPMASFPLVVVLRDNGTGLASLIAYLTSWTTLAFQRMLIWEIPLMGSEFAIMRFVASLPLPFVAAFTAKLLPQRLKSDAVAGDA